MLGENDSWRERAGLLTFWRRKFLRRKRRRWGKRGLGRTLMTMTLLGFPWTGETPSLRNIRQGVETKISSGNKVMLGRKGPRRNPNYSDSFRVFVENYFCNMKGIWGTSNILLHTRRIRLYTLQTSGSWPAEWALQIFRVLARRLLFVSLRARARESMAP